ncbi:MAG: hypothetical protein QOF71_2794 [Candidatus Eremiobacteraeota bacterium]|jgi:hypothetical protein|nr:hypothetical protein [Candidatus Eremiobacteraeota bacterium]
MSRPPGSGETPDAEPPAPDFAMRRAVEILAQVYEAGRGRPNVAPAPLDRAVVLANEQLVLALGTTTRADVERAFGVAFSYPMRGWHTYAAREDGKRYFLSLFYVDAALVALEYYVPKADRAPGLAARDYGSFRLSPGDVALDAAFSSLDERYVTAVGGPAPVVYAQAYEARFPGGVAYVMGNGGRIERLGLYAAT